MRLRAPGPQVVIRCRLSEGYGHRDTFAANLIDPNDPQRKSHPSLDHLVGAMASASALFSQYN
jgi:hypothetical protein